MAVVGSDETTGRARRQDDEGGTPDIFEEEGEGGVEDGRNQYLVTD